VQNKEEHIEFTAIQIRDKNCHPNEVAVVKYIKKILKLFTNNT